MQVVLEPKDMVIARKTGIKTTILGAYTTGYNLIVLFADLKEYIVQLDIKGELRLESGNRLMDGDICINEELFDKISEHQL